MTAEEKKNLMTYIVFAAVRGFWVFFCCYGFFKTQLCCSMYATMEEYKVLLQMENSAFVEYKLTAM